MWKRPIKNWKISLPQTVGFSLISLAYPREMGDFLLGQLYFSVSRTGSWSYIFFSTDRHPVYLPLNPPLEAIVPAAIKAESQCCQMDIRAYLLNAASQSCLSFLLLPRLSCELYRCSSGTDKLTSADTARKEKRLRYQMYLVLLLTFWLHPC